ncbi:mitogen-activated protein kinase kinase kinase a [Anaeramoeba flamelloides]|uniref:Mitogen-activated protein kinase kinase kinase a n=1 Tax=Anaeramoeba flamelloides TaxID=1746091 RepID=A0AAV8A9I7_9EUKA|nr:mitogen-activated protein kinase kinase kinase a [Anaeramoeba flamelloides]
MGNCFPKLKTKKKNKTKIKKEKRPNQTVETNLEKNNPNQQVNKRNERKSSKSDAETSNQEFKINLTQTKESIEMKDINVLSGKSGNEGFDENKNEGNKDSKNGNEKGNENESENEIDTRNFSKNSSSQTTLPLSEEESLSSEISNVSGNKQITGDKRTAFNLNDNEKVNKNIQFDLDPLTIMCQSISDHQILMNSSRRKSDIRWRKDALLGQGSYGKVFLGFNLDSGELIAVKQIPQCEHNPKEMDQLQKEVKLMSQLEHENIVKYLGTSKDKDFVNIFLEYIPGGSLSSLLSRFGKLEESVIQLYTRQILQGLKYLHYHNILHGDIKGANLLVDTDGSIKLADFGAAEEITGYNKSNETTNLRGTPFWMAPEVIRNNTYRKESDIWSLGCTVVEMLTAQRPWSNYNEAVSVLFHIGTCETGPSYPSTISEECKDFLDLCFQIDPDERPSTGILLKHPFVLNSQEIRSPKRLGSQYQLRKKKIQIQRKREKLNLPDKLFNKFQNSKLSDTELTFLKSRKNSRKLIQKNFQETSKNFNIPEIPFITRQISPIKGKQIKKGVKRTIKLSPNSTINSRTNKKKVNNNHGISNMGGINNNPNFKMSRLNSQDFSKHELKDQSPKLKNRETRKSTFEKHIKKPKRNRSYSLQIGKSSEKQSNDVIFNQNIMRRKYIYPKFNENIQTIQQRRFNSNIYNNHNNKIKKTNNHLHNKPRPNGKFSPKNEKQEQSKKQPKLKYNTHPKSTIRLRKPKKTNYNYNNLRKQRNNNYKTYLMYNNKSQIYRNNGYSNNKHINRSKDRYNNKKTNTNGNNNNNNNNNNNMKNKNNKEKNKDFKNKNSNLQNTIQTSPLRTFINKGEGKKKFNFEKSFSMDNHPLEIIKKKNKGTNLINKPTPNQIKNESNISLSSKKLTIQKNKKNSLTIHEDEEIEKLNKEIAGLRKRMKNRLIHSKSKPTPISNYNNYKLTCSLENKKFSLDQLISPRYFNTNSHGFSPLKNPLKENNMDKSKKIQKKK